MATHLTNVPTFIDSQETFSGVPPSAHIILKLARFNLHISQFLSLTVGFLDLHKINLRIA
jgi:hypothetical protein